MDQKRTKYRGPEREGERGDTTDPCSEAPGRVRPFVSSGSRLLTFWRSRRGAWRALLLICRRAPCLDPAAAAGAEKGIIPVGIRWLSVRPDLWSGAPSVFLAFSRSSLFCMIDRIGKRRQGRDDEKTKYEETRRRKSLFVFVVVPPPFRQGALVVGGGRLGKERPGWAVSGSQQGLAT